MAGRVAKKGLVLLLFLMVSGVVYAQYTIRHQAPIAMVRGEGNELIFNVAGITESDVQQARIFYRYNGGLSYQQQEVNFQGGSFRTLFRINNNSASSVEYYFELTLNSGEGIYYPGNLPSENPVEVEIVDELEKEEKPKMEGVDYTILSPDAGTGVARNNVVIAIALFYDIDAIEPGEFKLLIDGVDVTGQADTSTYYISYVPKNLRSGPHTISLDYETESETYSVVEWDFAVVAPGQAAFQGFTESNAPRGQVELTARNQVISSDVNNAYTGRTRISGSYGDFRYSANGYLTSQQSPRLQPQNRYGVNLRYGEWWNFEAGHVYPSISQFTISGRRVHGINTSLHLLNEKLNMQFIYGELDRKITNQYDSLIVEDIVIGADSVVDKNYILTYQDGGRGTFQRKITGGRLSFGDEDAFQWGFHALKIQDDTTSILNVRDYLDIANSGLALNNNLSPEDYDSLIANPDQLDIRTGNVKPRGNLVAGSDVKFSLNDNRIRFESEAVVSALNDNIYDGPLTVERASDLGFDIDAETADLLEQLSWLIIVNENMDTLPLKISEDENGDFTADPFFPTSILAGNSDLSFRYPNNNFRVQYRWIGPNFNSLANSTVRKDVAGFTFTDRLNLLQNRLYITLGYENLNDNVSGTRDATINTISYRTNLSWYPVDRSLPRVSVSFRYRTRDNGVKRQNFLLSDDLLNAAVRNIRQEQRTINGQDTLVTLVTPTPRRNNTININTSITQQFDALGARNDASISYTNLTTTDKVFAFGDVNSTALSLNFTSRFNNSPLESQFGLTYNDTESGNGQSQINILGYYAGGNIYMLDNRLSINARLALTQNETTSRGFGINDNGNDNPYDDYFELDNSNITKNNFQTFVIQAGARFNITDNHALVFDANFTNVSQQNSANDRIMQLRYVFSY